MNGLSIPRRVELVKRIKSGESLKDLAKEFERTLTYLQNLAFRFEKEGTDWYLRPRQKTGRRERRPVTKAEEKSIRSKLEKRLGPAKKGWNLKMVSQVMGEELSFLPLRKEVLATMSEWGVEPIGDQIAGPRKMGLGKRRGDDVILAREKKRRRAVNKKVSGVSRGELKLFGSPIGLRGRSAIRWRKRDLDETRVCDYLIEIWTAGPEFLLDERGKGICRRELMKLGKHSGLKLLTYVIMDSHCFLVLRVPAREKWMARFYEGTDQENETAILAHVEECFKADYKYFMNQKLKTLRGAARKKYILKIADSFCQLSEEIKRFKEAVTAQVNAITPRAGTFWGERFGSKRLFSTREILEAGVLVDGWAGKQGLLVDEKPEAYPWCGFAEAAGGSKRFRKGFCNLANIPVVSMTRRGKIEGLEGRGLPLNLYRKRLLKERG